MKDTNQVSDLAYPFLSIRAVLDNWRERHPDKTALYNLDQEKSASYAQLHEAANRVARLLESLGVKKGDKVGLLADECLEKLLIWMGIWRLGAVVCPLNVEINASHIQELLQTIGPKITLWHKDVDGIAMTEGVCGTILRFDEWHFDYPTGSDGEELFTRLAAVDPAPEVTTENGPDDLSCIFCTSGTTDKPKSVVYNHMAYWLNGLNTIDFLGLSEEDKTLEYRSFGWNSAQVLSLMPWIVTGLSMHFAKRFSRSRFFKWINAHEITFAAGVPTVINMLLNESTGVTDKDIPSLRLMTCSTAPLSPEQWQNFESMYGVTLLQLYGMSEAGWVCGNRHNRRRMGTVGPPAKHQRFQIIDGDGNPCSPGAEGEVTVSGPQTSVFVITPEGEWEDQRAQPLRTGDLAVMDKDGFVTVTGRTKDLIIRGGVNISPLEIDHALLKSDKISEAGTIGVPDDIYGEEVVCYVVPKPGATLTADEVLDHAGAIIPKFKCPKQAYIADELPKSDRGKIRRDDLKKIWARDHRNA